MRGLALGIGAVHDLCTLVGQKLRRKCTDLIVWNVQRVRRVFVSVYFSGSDPTSVERADDSRLRMCDLAEVTVISRSNLTRLVDRMESAGLVERVRSTENRRGALQS